MVRCKVSFYDVPTGYVFPAGAKVPAGSAVIARHPQFFDVPPVAPVEAATAAPGEKRAVKPRATRKAAPK